MEKVIVYGATSAVATAVIQRMLERGDDVVMVGRNEQKLSATSEHLFVLTKKRASFITSDFSDAKALRQSVKDADKQLSGATVCLIAQGSLTRQEYAINDSKELQEAFAVNCFSVLFILQEIRLLFMEKKCGNIAVITSPAGDRGRQSNYIYGSSKGAVSIFLQGLRNELFPHDIKVLDIKPGFIDTPMTKDISKGPLFVKPEKVAQDIIHAISKGKKILYTPWYWKWVMLIIKNLPSCVFDRLKL